MLVGLSFLVALGVYAGLSLPSLRDLGIVALVLLGCAVLSLVAGHLAYVLPWLKRSPRIFWTLFAGHVLVGVLILLGVLTSALLMFIDSEDVRLVAAFLLFGVGIAVSLGYLLAMGMSEEAKRLVEATDRVAEGQFDVRIQPRGNDEMASLARAFNAMTEALADSAAAQSAAERTRLDLVAWAGHDLRTPLTSVMVMVEALADGVVSDPETADRYLQTAKRDLRVLGLLIDDLSLLAQSDAGGLQLAGRVGSLEGLLSELAESFSPQARRKGVRVITDAQGVMPLCFDDLHVRRALTNIIENAVRHVREGGTVRVEARSQTGGARIQVWNDGPAIDPSDLPYIFDRFYRSDKSRSRTTGGAGLGLAIAKAIMEAHGGSVAVESEPDRGTRFILTLASCSPSQDCD
ncbi:MAG TPA: HAMP domain-containing sensor histidine kinase [Thermoleophilia bacterium]|nr:HAMP domain-containing sensor histidine kinase [Thermoleophilia bacterium]